MTNFDAGFDRKKKNFIDKANKGDGFTPIDYSFIKNLNAQILKVNYIKSGTIDNYFISSFEIHVNYLEANEISAGTIRAGKIIVSEVDVSNLYADHIYSNNIDNKQTINTFSLNSTDITNKLLITTLELVSGSQYGGNAVFERLNFGVTVPIFGKPILPGFFNGFGTVDLIASITIRPDATLWPTNNFNCTITNNTSFNSGVFNLASKAGINMYDDTQVIISVGEIDDEGEMTISSKNEANFTARNELNITTTNSDVNLSNINIHSSGDVGISSEKDIAMVAVDEIAIGTTSQDVQNSSIKFKTEGLIRSEAKDIAMVAVDEINISTTSQDVQNSSIKFKTEGLIRSEADRTGLLTTSGNTLIYIDDARGVQIQAHDGDINSKIELNSKSSILLRNNLTSINMSSNGSMLIGCKNDVNIYSASGTIELEAASGINITSNLTATNNVKGDKSITFGGITFESQAGSVGTYYWPAPPLLPAITSFYFLSPSKVSIGTLSWESQLLATEVLIPYSITYASPILDTGEVEFVTQFIPESLPFPDTQEIIIGPFFTTDEFGVISILTRTITILPLPVATQSLTQKIMNDKKITIDGTEYTIPPIA
jgi:hypothetical protein